MKPCWSGSCLHISESFRCNLSLKKQELQEGEKREEKIPNSLCVILFSTEISLDECSHSGWIGWIVVSGFFGLGLVF